MSETVTLPAAETALQRQPSRSERRVSRRRPPKGGTRVACRKGTLGLGPNLAVQVLDLSETGIRLIVRAKLAAGDQIEFEMVCSGQLRPFKLLARVAWAVATADGNQCIGARFERELKYRDLLLMTSLTT